MKALLMLLIVLSGVKHPIKPDSTNYVEFKRNDLTTTKIILPLIISKSKPKIKVNYNEDPELSWFKTKEDYINAMYIIAITDQRTYTALLKFINDNAKFYYPGDHTYYYKIIIPGKVYYLQRKNVKEFFTTLTTYLNAQYYDYNVVLKLQHMEM